MPQLDPNQDYFPDLVACHECDLLITKPELQPGQKAKCPRCNYALAERGKNVLNYTVAVAITGLLLLAFSLSFPFLGFYTKGQDQSITLWQAIGALWTNGYPILSILGGTFILVMPALYLSSVIYLLVNFKYGRNGKWSVPLLNSMFFLRPWAMAEVFFIGVLISLIKVAAMAAVQIGISFWAFVLFCIAFPVVIAMTDRHQLWDWYKHGYHEE